MEIITEEIKISSNNDTRDDKDMILIILDCSTLLFDVWSDGCFFLSEGVLSLLSRFMLSFSIRSLFGL